MVQTSYLEKQFELRFLWWNVVRQGPITTKVPALDRVGQHVQKWIWVVFAWYRLMIFRKCLLLTILLKSTDFLTLQYSVLSWRSFLFKFFDESINNMDFLKTTTCAVQRVLRNWSKLWNQKITFKIKSLKIKLQTTD